jgi:hypothetical protein
VAVPEAPVLTSPADGVEVRGIVEDPPGQCWDTDSVPELDWSPASGATTYTWEFRNVSKSKPPRTGTTANTSASLSIYSGTHVTHVQLISGDTYRWRVRGLNSQGDAGAWSQERSIVGIDGEALAGPCVRAPGVSVVNY